MALSPSVKKALAEAKIAEGHTPPSRRELKEEHSLVMRLAQQLRSLLSVQGSFLSSSSSLPTSFSDSKSTLKARSPHTKHTARPQRAQRKSRKKP